MNRCKFGVNFLWIAVCATLLCTGPALAQDQITAKSPIVVDAIGLAAAPGVAVSPPSANVRLKPVDGTIPPDASGPKDPPPNKGGDDLRFDCNGNGIPDGCDLDCGPPSCSSYPGCGMSEDCNGNGIPDECELYGLDYVYSYDDGGSEYGLRSAGTHLAWMNYFTVVGEAVLIDAIDLTYVNVVEEAPTMVYLWSDPDGDGDPTDAQVLASVPSATVNNPGGVFRVDIPDTYVGPAGTGFFVGTILAYPNEDAFPCPLDATAPTTLGVSWIIGRDGPIDPNDLSNGAIEFNLLEIAIGQPMNVVVRAVAKVPSGDCNLNGIPDDCDIAEGTSTDLNGNGVPDECEDCNANGVPDSWDVDPNDPDGNGQVSPDCQADDIPDECQLVGNDCNNDGVPDECQLGANDCNGNGVPDECDIAAGTSTDLNGNGIPDDCEDCNENGVPDAWDVDPNDPDGNGEVSEDCQPDGIPDECQWGTPTYETYAVDDGTAEAQAGSGFPADICWLNHFTVEEGMETVSFVEIMYSTGTLGGSPVTILLWSDPDGDGSPADAQVITSVASTVTNNGQGVFVSVPVGDIEIGPAGTSFFVGAIYRDESGFAYPILRDADSSQGESWLSITDSLDLLDPNDLDASAYFGRLDSFWGGNCMIRARAFSGAYPNDCNQNGIPDDCDIASGLADDLDGNGILDECEDCNGNGIPDGCDVTCDGPCGAIPGCGQSADCDGNGNPDECDIVQGADCNNNGVPDACDVPPIGSYSLDCNADLVPDECQLAGNDCNNNGIPDDCDLGGPPVPQYVLDDGSSENSIGLGSGGTLAWLNHFVVETNGESIKGIRVAYGGVAPGTAATVYLWGDPDGNGNPNDAQVLASASTTVQNPGSDMFTYVDITETYVGEAGASFFVGVIIQHAAAEFPAAVDQNTDEGESWIAGGATVNPNSLSAAGLFGKTGDFGFGGNLLVRAVPAADAPPNDCNSNGVPDECDLDAGTSEDCNENGVPDECDVPPLGDYSLDCNGNLVPDECDIASGKDCDGNGIPDDCQPEDDCDDNGLLDICELDYTNGLVGQYWRAIGGSGNFSQRLMTRVDPTIDFDWGGSQPDPDVPADEFTVRWTGLLLTPAVSGAYTFFAKADDGVRLWINDELLIDEWHSSSGDEYSSTITLLGNYAYHIRLEYYEGGGGAKVYLKWTTPNGSKEVVPTEALYPSEDCNGNSIPDACDIDAGTSDDLNGNGVPDECEDCNGNGVFDDQDVAAGTSEDCNGNGLPDECEVAGGNDCNGNGVPDDCELDEFDCDNNGIHDACQALFSGLVGQYFGNDSFSGTPHVQLDSTIDFNWGDDSPAPGIPANDFTVRWTGALMTHAAGTYYFRADRDDGFRLYINGAFVFEGENGSIDLPENTLVHIRAEYWENSGGARVTLYWTPPGESEAVVPSEDLYPAFDGNANGDPDVCEFGDCNGNGIPDPMDLDLGLAQDCDGNGVPDECQGNCDCDGNGMLETCEAEYASGLVGQYWTSNGGDGDFSARLLIRVDPVIDFNWGGGSPDPLVPSDHFAARWTGTVTTTDAAGTYTFYTHTDDGVRLWVDNQLLINKWQNQSGTEWSGSISLAADTAYLITMEYYDSGGSAEARLSWQPPGGVKEVIPTEALGPMADADGDGVPDSCGILDCNNNGVSDLEDIALGTSEDCNGNCTPDECDLVLPPLDYGQAYWRFEEAGGATVVDSGPNGLDGTLNGLPSRTTDVAVDPVPLSGDVNMQSLDLNWQSTSSGGFFNVPDTSGALTMGNQNFTIEAWVKLDHLSNTSSNDDRQYLCQKKPLPSQDSQIDYAFLVQRGNLSLSPNYGKNSGISGRELQLYFGNGSSQWGITSYLEINDLDWHFVSAAFDTNNNTVRFGIDDTFETVSFNDNPRVTNGGPLRVGSHQNGVGVDNFFLRGTIDELRISRGVVPTHELLNAPGMSYSLDENGNGVPDECEEGILGDLDGDGDVDFDDLNILLAAYGANDGGDLDGDGDTDFDDLNILLANYQ